MLASILKFEIMCLLLPTKTFSCNISIISATVNYMTFELEYDQNHYKRAKNISPFHQHLCRLKWCFPLEIVQLLLPTRGNIACQRSLFIALELWFQKCMLNHANHSMDRRSKKEIIRMWMGTTVSY